MAHAWYDNWLFWTLSTSALVVLLAALSLWAWLRVTAIQRGVTRTLRNISDRLVRDVMLPDGIGGLIIDQIVL